MKSRPLVAQAIVFCRLRTPRQNPQATKNDGPRHHFRDGFTLLEVLVATLIMGIAVAGLLNTLSTAVRNASHLTEYDRATLLAKAKMDELLVDQKLPRDTPLAGTFPLAQSGGVPAGWNATVTAFEKAPGTGPGQWVVDRIALEIWWMDGSTRRAFSLEAFRRSIL